MIDKLTIQQIDTIEDPIDYTIIDHPDFQGNALESGRLQGTFKNFRFIKKSNRLNVVGSLTKYGYGTNAFNADMHMSKLFLNDLINTFHLKQDATIIELEFGFNIPVLQKVSSYINQLQYAISYKDIYKHKEQEIKFIQENKQIRIYDKTQHFIQNKSLLSNPFDNSINLLRYEIILKNPGKVLGLKKPLSIFNLLDKKIIDRLMTMWVNEFNCIIQHTHLKPCLKVETPKDVFDHLILKGIEGYGGLSHFLPHVNSIEFKAYNNEYKKRVKDTVIQLSKKDNYSVRTNYMKELENKIKFTARHYLMQGV